MASPSPSDTWRNALTSVYQKRARKHWRVVSIEVMAVACGVKTTYLFDQWSSTPEEMARLLRLLYDEGLTRLKLDLVVVGSDLLIYSKQSFLACIERCRPHHPRFVDVSFYLDKPALVVLAEEEEPATKVKDTIKTFSTFIDFVRDASSDSDSNNSSQGQSDSNNSNNGGWYEVDVTDKINPSSLFGLFLGYPWIYWFDRSDQRDDNCLSTQPLRLYRVKGHAAGCCHGNCNHNENDENGGGGSGRDSKDVVSIVNVVKNCAESERETRSTPKSVLLNCASDSSDSRSEERLDDKLMEKNLVDLDCAHELTSSSGGDHLLFSFSVPETVLKSAATGSGMTDLHTEDWFSSWKSATSWNKLFDCVWLEQTTVELAAVAL